MTYTFVFSDRSEADPEPDGIEFDSLDAAVNSATRALAEIAQEQDRNSGLSVIVKEGGEPMARVTLVVSLEHLA